jgi:hypothetical protein
MRRRLLAAPAQQPNISAAPMSALVTLWILRVFHRLFVCINTPPTALPLALVFIIQGKVSSGCTRWMLLANFSLSFTNAFCDSEDQCHLLPF